MTSRIRSCRAGEPKLQHASLGFLLLQRSSGSSTQHERYIGALFLVVFGGG